VTGIVNGNCISAGSFSVGYNWPYIQQYDTSSLCEGTASYSFDVAGFGCQIDDADDDGLSYESYLTLTYISSDNDSDSSSSSAYNNLAIAAIVIAVIAIVAVIAGLAYADFLSGGKKPLASGLDSTNKL
jgi:hypothetical protein